MYRRCANPLCHARMRRVNYDEATAEARYECPRCGLKMTIDLRSGAVLACSGLERVG